MSEPTHAVFLSYASQDAQAAKRICETLRAGGVVVLDTTRSIQEAWGTGPSTGIIYRCPDTNHPTSGS